MKEKYLNRGSITLFIIAFMFTLVTATICNVCDADKVTIIASAAMAGLVSVMGIGACFEIENLEMPIGPESGFVGVIIGTIIALLVF